MKKLTKNDWITFAVTTVLILLPMAFGLAVYHKLPSQMPVHWNGAGEVDGYSSRAMAVISFLNSTWLGSAFSSTSISAALNQPRLRSQGFLERPSGSHQKAVLLAS